jgi:hypothetical protein
MQNEQQEDQNTEDFLYYSFRPLNEIGEIETTLELSHIIEEEKNTRLFQSCKDVIEKSGSAGVKATFKGLTLGLDGKHSVLNEVVSSHEFTERFFKRVEERLRIFTRVNHADNDFGYLRKCIAVSFLNMTATIVVSEELIQVSRSRDYIEALMGTFRYDHTMISLCCRCGVPRPRVTRSNFRTLDVPVNLHLIDYQSMVQELRTCLQASRNTSTAPHSGGLCVSYPNQYLAVLNGLSRILDKFMPN